MSLKQIRKTLNKKLFHHRKGKKFERIKRSIVKWNTLKYLVYDTLYCISFLQKKYIEVNDLPGHQYFVNKNTRFKIPMLRPDLCGYGEAYIVMKRTVDLLAADANENDKSEQELAFKNTTPFT